MITPKIDNVVSKVIVYNPQANSELIKEAYEFAEKAHRGENRLNGEPLTDHCIIVANLLAEIKTDSATLAAALLHQTIEHRHTTKKTLEDVFGNTVAELVDGFSTIRHIQTKTGQHKQTENLRKLLLATAKDFRVILIRLADKLHNLQTIEGIPKSQRAETAVKALEIYAPIADRLGLYYFKWQLEDEAFKYQNRRGFALIQNFLAETRVERERYIQKIANSVSKKLESKNIKAEIYGRPKHFYSIYKKILAKRKPNETERDCLEHLDDIQAFRILVNTIDECYQTLGIIHRFWEPWRDMRDYIAKPKPNGYRSLHTYVLCEDAKIVEFQIRTYQMHHYNEFGPAAHAFYKEIGYGKGGRVCAPENYSIWLQKLVKWQKKVGSEKKFEEALKINVFADRVFALTPKNDVLDLPQGATPIDFAYQIHSDLGNSCIGAKIDGKLTALDSPLQSGQVVEILTSKTRKTPSPDWLEFIKTSEARKKIKTRLQDRSC